MRGRGLVSIFCSCLTSFPSIFYWRRHLLLYIFRHFVKNPLTEDVWIYFWALWSLPLVFMSHMSIACWFCYCGCVVLCLEIRISDASNFTLFPQHFFGHPGNFGILLFTLAKNAIGCYSVDMKNTPTRFDGLDPITERWLGHKNFVITNSFINLLMDS
jgi:hypothetical protein